MAFLGLASMVALIDLRRGWYLAVLCGVLQDPVRKLTPGTPVVLTMSIVAVYFVILFGAQATLQRHFREFLRKFSSVQTAGALLLFFLLLAAMNGLVTYGIEYWKVPALSLFIYCAPVPAVLLGFTFMQREEDIYRFFSYYAALTSVTMIGSLLELIGFRWTTLGLVGMPEGFIRHLPGIQLRIISGFYRAPDIMAWHAAMLAIVGIIMAMRSRLYAAMAWMAVAGWGFYNCIISGRRKSIYMVAVFAAVFVWRYVRRMNIAQLVSMVLLGVTMLIVIYNVKHDQRSSVYAAGAATTQEEIFERLEGGLSGTIEQTGIMGAGLGTATQGVRHLLGRDDNIGWQEGGLGKLAIELGVPGLLAAVLFAFTILRVLMKVTSLPDVPESTQFIRCALFAIFVANIVEFMVSAQAYSDATLTLTTAFLLGCMFATAVLDERRKERDAAAAIAPVLMGRPANGERLVLAQAR
jgi:hypothetical protein